MRYVSNIIGQPSLTNEDLLVVNGKFLNMEIVPMPMRVYKSCCHPVAAMILIIYVDNNEATLMALVSCCCEVVWARKLAIELGFPQLKPTNVYEDITGCAALANNCTFAVAASMLHYFQKHVVC